MVDLNGEHSQIKRGREAGLKVRDSMTRDVVSVSADTSVKDAAVKMLDNNIGCVVVMDGSKPVGIMTERDFLTIARHSTDPSTIPVSKVMSTELVTIDPDSDLSKAGKLMKEKNIRRLPVKEDERLVGIITSKDLVTIGSLTIGNVRRWLALKLIEYTTIPFR
jgi:CBS domain-containing protein